MAGPDILETMKRYAEEAHAMLRKGEKLLRPDGGGVFVRARRTRLETGPDEELVLIPGKGDKQ